MSSLSRSSTGSTRLRLKTITGLLIKPLATSTATSSRIMARKSNSGISLAGRKNFRPSGKSIALPVDHFGGAPAMLQERLFMSLSNRLVYRRAVDLIDLEVGAQSNNHQQS